MDSTTQRLMTSAGGPVDPFFENVTMLLHGDGTNGAQNNTFIDSSTNNFTITRNGNTTQGSLNPFGDRWSNYFDGTGDFLSVSSNASFDLGSSSFTVEAWINPSSLANGYAIASRYNFSSPTGSGWAFRVVNSTTIRFVRGNDVILDGTTTISIGAWTHVAAVRDGSTLTLYVNGAQVAQATGIVNFSDATTSLQIGRTNTLTDDASGYTSNLRIVKGTAVYTAAFTPPAAPLTAITNTSLLTCQSNRFIDNSSNNFTITRNGDVSVRPFSPFAPSAPYSTSVNGGSGYFDGTGDTLTCPSSSAFAYGTGDFTWEMWIYPTASNWSSSNRYMLDHGLNGGVLSFESNTFHYYNATTGTGSALYTGGGIIVPWQWSHIAASRSSGTTRIFVNGALRASGSDTHNYGTQAVTIADYGGGNLPFLGYISNVRLLKGTALYTAAFTPPTAPLTAITNTSLLLNFTNGGIIDNAADNVLETVGNAQISTSVKKYGTGSLAFDGTGDYLSLATSPLFGFNSGEFTIEFWLYPTSVTGTQVLVDFRTNVSQAVPEIYLNGTSLIYYLSGADRITATSAISQNTWQHVALVKSGTTTKFYVNGTNVGSSYSDTNTYLSTAPVKIGTYYGGDLVFYTGYIDDLRITKGVARYTADFTPPSGPFPDM